MKVVETEECQEVPSYMLRLGQHVIYSKLLSSLLVLSSIIQVHEIHVGILTGQNIGLPTFCTASCSFITSFVVLFISISLISGQNCSVYIV